MFHPSRLYILCVIIVTGEIKTYESRLEIQIDGSNHEELNSLNRPAKDQRPRPAKWVN